MRRAGAVLLVLALAAPASAQEGSLDVLDGETLYEGGWLFTLGYENERRAGLRDGANRVSDPLDRRLETRTMAVGAHYGLLYNLQLSAIVPYIDRALTVDDPSGPDRFRAEGLGDAVFVAKWRYHRWDDVGKALNVAVLAAIEAPTGEDGRRDNGLRLPPELQPGSGSVDASIGTAVTYEPGRWRFNAAVLVQYNGEGAQGFKFGDEVFAELAAGNRFWLEPYPGPFMRFDVLLRYRHESRAELEGSRVGDSGGDLVTAGATLAFRPRPTIDVQAFLEVPVYQSVNGTQIEEDLSVFFALGFRM